MFVFVLLISVFQESCFLKKYFFVRTMKSTCNPACNEEEQSTSKNQDNKLKGKLRPIPIRMKKVNQGTSTVGDEQMQKKKRDEQMPKKKLQVCSYHMLPLFSFKLHTTTASISCL